MELTNILSWEREEGFFFFFWQVLSTHDEGSIKKGRWLNGIYNHEIYHDLYSHYTLPLLSVYLLSPSWYSSCTKSLGRFTARQFEGFLLNSSIFFCERIEKEEWRMRRREKEVRIYPKELIIFQLTFVLNDRLLKLSFSPSNVYHCYLIQQFTKILYSPFLFRESLI